MIVRNKDQKSKDYNDALKHRIGHHTPMQLMTQSMGFGLSLAVEDLQPGKLLVELLAGQ